MLALVSALVLLFMLGSLSGTWIDHAANAIPARQPWFSAPACPACTTPWRGLALLPIVGPLVARCCPKCNASIPWQRLATEVATATLFVLAYWRRGPTPAFVATAFFIAILLVIMRIDWRHHLIFPNTIVLGLLVAFGYAALFAARQFALLWATVAAVGAGLFFLLLYLLGLAVPRWRKLGRPLGFGDVLLAILIGAMTGLNTALALFIGMLLNAAGGLALVALRLRTMHDFVPLGAYLCVGAIVTLLL